MVAMNPQSYKEDLAEIVPGGWLLYDSTLPRIWPRDDITVLGVPIAEMCAAQVERSAPAPAVQEHGLRRRADGAARHRPRGAEGRRRRPAQGQGEAGRRQHGGGRARPRVRAQAFRLPAADQGAPCRARQGQDHGDRQRCGRARRHLRRRHRVRLVSDHAVDLAGRGLREVRPAPARDQGRQAPVRHRAGRGRAGGHRRRHRRRLERRALVHGDLGARHLADERVPGARLLRRGAGGAVQHPARRTLDRHADAHAAVRHHLLRLRLARRHQARAAVPGQPDRMLLDGRAGLRSRRAAADARSSSCPTSTSA